MSEHLGSGQFKPAYTGARPDLAGLVPPRTRSLLDVGCATGEMGAALKSRYPGLTVTGIEVDSDMATVAGPRLDRVVVCSAESIEDLERELGADRFDCVVCGDILEHLKDPWLTLRVLVQHLAADGVVLLSLPNVGHLDTAIQLFLRQRWPYRDRGIHDSGHLRFFARRNVDDLLAGAGLELVRMVRRYRIVERPHRLNRLARRLALPGLRNLLTFQFVVVARRALGPPRAHHDR